jgi:hypothetical protein
MIDDISHRFFSKTNDKTSQRSEQMYNPYHSDLLGHVSQVLVIRFFIVVLPVVRVQCRRGVG